MEASDTAGVEQAEAVTPKTPEDIIKRTRERHRGTTQFTPYMADEAEVMQTPVPNISKDPMDAGARDAVTAAMRAEEAETGGVGGGELLVQQADGAEVMQTPVPNISKDPMDAGVRDAVTGAMRAEEAETGGGGGGDVTDDKANEELMGEWEVMRRRGTLVREKADLNSNKVAHLGFGAVVTVDEVDNGGPRTRLHIVENKVKLMKGEEEEVTGWISMKNDKGIDLVRKVQFLPPKDDFIMYRQSLLQHDFFLQDNIKCKIGGQFGFNFYSVELSVCDKKLLFYDYEDKTTLVEEVNLKGATVKNTKDTKLEIEYQDPSTSKRKKCVLNFGNPSDKSLWKGHLRLATTSYDISDEKVIAYSEKGINFLAGLLGDMGKEKHTVVIMGHHGEMSNRIFHIPVDIEIVMKGSIGHTTSGFPNQWCVDESQYFLFFDSLSKHVAEDTLSIDGCINPELSENLVASFGRPRTDSEDINLKISGGGKNRPPFPEHLMEAEGQLKSGLTVRDIERIDEKTLRQHLSNDVTMQFSDIKFYKNHGLLFEIQGRDGTIQKVRLLLVKPAEAKAEEKAFSRSELHTVEINISSRVIETLEKLQKLTDQKFVVLFADCRVRATALNRQLSKKTDKSIDCWFKFYSEKIIKKKMGRGVSQGETDFVESLHIYLKANFSSMNDVYRYKKTAEYTDMDEEGMLDALYYGYKKQIVENVLLLCLIHAVTNNPGDPIIDQIKVRIPQRLNSLNIWQYTDNRNMVLFLVDNGANYERRGFTILHHAVSNSYEQAGDTKFVTDLLDMGLDINAKDSDEEQTPLHKAVRRNRISMVELLLKKGADKEVKDKNGKTPLDIAVAYKNKTILELFE